MKISLENYLRNSMDELETMQDYSVATDSIRALIDVWKETEKPNEVKEVLQDILKEWTESKFKKGLNLIIRERLK